MPVVLPESEFVHFVLKCLRVAVASIVSQPEPKRLPGLTGQDDLSRGTMQ